MKSQAGFLVIQVIQDSPINNLQVQAHVTSDTLNLAEY